MWKSQRARMETLQVKTNLLQSRLHQYSSWMVGLTSLQWFNWLTGILATGGIISIMIKLGYLSLVNVLLLILKISMSAEIWSLRILNMLIWVCLKTALDIFIKILMRISLRPEKKQECYSLLILTWEEWITLYNVCSVHQGMFSISGDIMMHVGDIMRTSIEVQYIGGYHEYIREYHEYIGVCSVQWGKS